MPTTETWTGSNGNPWPGQWTVSKYATATVDIQGNQGRMVTGVSAGQTADAYLSGMSALADSELLVNVTHQNPIVAQWAHLCLRSNGDFGTPGTFSSGSTCYIFETDPASNLFSIYRVAGGSVSVAGSTSYIYTAGVAVWVRFRVAGAVLSAKIWDVGTTEPGGWTWTWTDPTPLSAGKVTLDTENSASSAMTVLFDDLTVTDLSVITLPDAGRAGSSLSVNKPSVTLPDAGRGSDNLNVTKPFTDSGSAADRLGSGPTLTDMAAAGDTGGRFHTTAGTTLTVPLVIATRYRVSVRARDLAGNISAYSTAILVDTSPSSLSDSGGLASARVDGGSAAITGPGTDGGSASSTASSTVEGGTASFIPTQGDVLLLGVTLAEHGTGSDALLAGTRFESGTGTDSLRVSRPVGDTGTGEDILDVTKPVIPPVAWTVSSSNPGSIHPAFTWPVSPHPAYGDLAVVVLQLKTAIPGTLTNDGGFTLLQTPVNSANGNATQAIFTKTCDGTETGLVTWTSSLSGEWVLDAIGLSNAGVDATAYNQVDNGVSALTDHPTCETTTTRPARVLSIMGGRASTTTATGATPFTPPAEIVLAVERNAAVSGVNNEAVGIATVAQVSPGLTVTGNWTSVAGWFSVSGVLSVYTNRTNWAALLTGRGHSIGTLDLGTATSTAMAGTGASSGTLDVTLTQPAAKPLSDAGTGSDTLTTARLLSVSLAGTGASSATLAATIQRGFALVAAGTGSSTGTLDVTIGGSRPWDVPAVHEVNDATHVPDHALLRTALLWLIDELDVPPPVVAPKWG